MCELRSRCGECERGHAVDGHGTVFAAEMIGGGAILHLLILPALNGSWLHAVKQTALDECVGLLLALSVETVVAIGKPTEEGVGTIVGIMLSYRLHACCIQGICESLLTIGGLEFELVSDTNQLNAILGSTTGENGNTYNANVNDYILHNLWR